MFAISFVLVKKHVKTGLILKEKKKYYNKPLKKNNNNTQ